MKGGNVRSSMKNFRDFDIIRYPVYSEKATRLIEVANFYTFIVDKTATKKEIKGAIERVFSVKVESVNTMVNKGKMKSFRRHPFRRSDFKKAIVRLAESDNIDLGV
ncbi:MAG: 50S ribosomal protein L23 [Holosporales bacterium]|jgi:large subunit ribosomal protein L23|nr:50S ribosomal protein L23 [Holosporales bacterium]